MEDTSTTIQGEQALQLEPDEQLPIGPMSEHRDDGFVFSPVLVCDLDGTVRHAKGESEFINDPEDVALFDGIPELLWAWRLAGFEITGATNQGGVAFGHKTPDSFYGEMGRMTDLFEKAGAPDPFGVTVGAFAHPEGTEKPYAYRSLMRKPHDGMLALIEQQLLQSSIIPDWDRSVFVGDRPEDRKCADAANVRFMHAEDFRQGKVPRFLWEEMKEHDKLDSALRINQPQLNNE